MRILQVANGFPHRAYGGVELHTHQLGRALEQRGHAVSVFTRHSDTASPDGTVVDEWVDGLQVRSVVNDFKGYDFVYHYLCAPVREAFERTLREVEPEVVHFQHLIGLSADLPALARSRGIRTVATVHEYWYACQRVMLQYADSGRCGGPATASCLDCVMSEEGRRGRPPPVSVARRTLAALRGWLGGIPAVGPAPNLHRFHTLREALRCYERITTPSQFVIDELARQGMRMPQAIALPLGVATEAYPEPSVPQPLPITVERPLRLGFIGQHLVHKGPHTLLEAMQRLPDLPLRADFHGLRWPDQSYDARLARLFASEPRAAYRGRFPEGARPGLLAEIDVLVVPSTCPESFGIAIREAHLAGRPVVSTDRGALPESIRHGEDGLLVPAEDPTALAAALRRLVREPGLLERLLAGARRARERVKSMNHYAAEIEQRIYS